MVDCRLRDERGGNPNLRHRRLGLVENARLLVICQSSAAAFLAAAYFAVGWKSEKNIVIIYLDFNGEK